MNVLWQDIRFALRLMAKTPGLTLIALFTLAIGIGANSAIYSMIYAVMMSPLPYSEPERLVYISNTWDGDEAGSLSGPDFADYERMTDSLEAMAAVHTFCKFNLSGVGEPITLVGWKVRPDIFKIFDEPFELGRPFLPEEGRLGSNDVAILSYQTWRNVFSADKDIIGETVILGESPYTIVGVLKPTLSFMEEMAQIYVPLEEEIQHSNRGNHYLTVFGRLKPGVSIDNAQADFDVAVAELQQRHPDSNEGKGILLIPLREIIVRDIRPAFYILYGAVAFVLLIACVNVANLLLARSNVRAKEIAIRCALGASRRRIIRQVLTESVVLSLAGGALGLLLAVWGLEAILALTPRMPGIGEMPFFDLIGINMNVLAFVCAVSIFTGLLFGAAPAVHAVRTDLNTTLKEGGRSASGATHPYVLNSLVTLQVALAVILLVCAGVFIQSFRSLQNADVGFRTDGIVTAQMEIPFTERNANNTERLAFYETLIERLRTVPGIEDAAAINIHPLSNDNTYNGFSIEGRSEPDNWRGYGAEYRNASPGYFKFMNIPLIKGRVFDAQDGRDGARVMVVNQELERRYFQDEEIIGQRINYNGELHTIIGVVGDILFRDLTGEENNPIIYVPIQQNCWHMMTVMAKTKGAPLSFADDIREAVWSIDPNQPVLRIQTMERIVDESISLHRFSAYLLMGMAAIALILASVGVYGVMSYTVSQSRHEIGVRIALGGSARHIILLITRRAMRFTGAGLLIGLGGAYALGRLIESSLFGISAPNAVMFSAVISILFIVAFFACYLPARRAARLDPMTVLRCE